MCVSVFVCECSILHSYICAECIVLLSSPYSWGSHKIKCDELILQSTCSPLCVFLASGSLISWFDFSSKDSAARALRGWLFLFGF